MAYARRPEYGSSPEELSSPQRKSHGREPNVKSPTSTLPPPLRSKNLRVRREPVKPDPATLRPRLPFARRNLYGSKQQAELHGSTTVRPQSASPRPAPQVEAPISGT